MNGPVLLQSILITNERIHFGSVIFRLPSCSTYAGGQISIGRLHDARMGFFDSGVPFLRGARIDGHSIQARCFGDSVFQDLHCSFYRDAGLDFFSR